MLRTLGAAGATLAVGVTGAAADEETDGSIDYSGLELPYPDTRVRRLHPSIRGVTSHPELLTMSESAVDRHFEVADVSGRTYERLRSQLRRIRRAYPVRTVQQGNTEMEMLAPRAMSRGPVTEFVDDRRSYRKLLSVFGGEGDVIRADWKTDHHRDMAYEALLDEGVYYGTVVDTADDPDYFADVAAGKVDDIADQVDPNTLAGELLKGTIVDVLKKILGVYHSNWAQYFDPNVSLLAFGSLGEVEFPGGLGKAHVTGGEFYEESRYATGTTAETKLGYSLHYLQDCAQPLHTGMGAEQAGFDVEGLLDDGLDYNLTPKYWLHYGYEDLVRDNWESAPSFGGDDLLAHFSGVGAPSRIYSAEQAIRDMAEESSVYSYDIYRTIYENEDKSTDYTNWDSSTKQQVYEDLANCFTALGYLSHGFVEEFEREH